MYPYVLGLIVLLVVLGLIWLARQAIPRGSSTLMALAAVITATAGLVTVISQLPT